MINAPHTSLRMPQNKAGMFGVPLLDEEFDPSEEEIFDHSELTPLHLFDVQEEEFVF